MIINHYGAGFVKIQAGDKVLAFNPVKETGNTGLKTARFGADIVLVSLRHPLYDGIANVSWGGKVPFLVDGPGEYEIGGIFVKGFLTSGPDQKHNTIYQVIFDGIRVVHLGALAESNLNEKIKEELGVVDVLFVPIGGDDLLDARQAARLVAVLEPRVVVPVNYDDKDSLKKFQKEIGAEEVKSVESYQLKKKELVGKESEVVIVKSL